MQFTSQQSSPKLKQFEEELNELLERYQYTLNAELSYTTKAVIPILQIRDKVPDKKIVKPNVNKIVKEKNGNKKH